MIDIDREAFSRDYGCTPSEWLGWMPRATQGLPWRMLDTTDRPFHGSSPAPAVGSMQIDFPDEASSDQSGRLSITWAVQEPRRIALVVLPRLRVSFQFQDVPLPQRLAFMRTFDLHLQRGGG